MRAIVELLFGTHMCFSHAFFVQKLLFLPMHMSDNKQTAFGDLLSNLPLIKKVLNNCCFLSWKIPESKVVNCRQTRDSKHEPYARVFSL